MTQLNDLHIIRQNIGFNRQPSHAQYLIALNDAIAPLCPYNVGTRDRTLFYAQLNGVKDHNDESVYSGGSRGYTAVLDVNNQDDGYFYRLVDAVKLFNFIQDISINTELNPYFRRSSEELFEDFLEEMSSESDWISLSRFALPDGRYKSPRSFTFWTSRNYDCRNVHQDSLKSGLASDWFVEPIVIMRCRIEDVLALNVSVKVPTVLDAFTEPIFYPRRDNNERPPGFGIAINIAQAPLTLGNEEFVLGEIPISGIEIRLSVPDVELNIHRKLFNSDLWSDLHDYYTTL